MHELISRRLVRENITEGERGVSLTLDIQIIDVNTCEPVPKVFLEMWHCNSTGVYSGVIANGNGDSSDSTNINNTFLRGIQQSDSDGVVVMETLFPGHYSGRATHAHIMTNRDATVNANKTLSGGSITHVGQMFFDQDLITAVSAVAPYSSNTQSITENSEDSILSQEATDVDPFMEYVLLGDSVADGLFGWLSFGIDTSNSFNVTPAAYLTDNGGVANSNNQGQGQGMGTPPGMNSTGPASNSSANGANGTNSTNISTTSVILSTATSGANRSKFPFNIHSECTY